MSKEDVVYDAVERLEWDERKEEDTPPKRLRQFTRRTALTGGAAGVAALMIEACGGSSSSSSNAGSGTSTASAATGGGGAAAGIFGESNKFKFTLVNHVTTNSFFTPTQSGAADACKLLGCSYQWTGSATSNIGEMVNAFNSAVSAGVDGLGVCLVDKRAFNSPVQKALSAKIPVVSYNADVVGNARLAYIGQDLFVSGQEVGQHIAQLVPSGDVAVFVATPGSLNLQPRLDGITAELKSHPGIKLHQVTTGAALPQEQSTVESFITSHPSFKGFFAVDGGSTQYTGQSIQKHGLASKGIKGGGYDLTPVTQKTLASGALQFTVDQQPYLQGFLPILELYLYKATQGLTGPADVNTGLKFLDKTTVVPYNSTKSRYEGTSTSVGIQKS